MDDIVISSRSLEASVLVTLSHSSCPSFTMTREGYPSISGERRCLCRRLERIQLGELSHCLVNSFALEAYKISVVLGEISYKGLKSACEMVTAY